MLTDEKTCNQYLIETDQLVYKDSGAGCNGTHDGFICWNATRANTTVMIPCPQIDGVFDISKFLYKTCSSEAVWEGFNRTKKDYGYTDFSTCYTDTAIKHASRMRNSSDVVYRIVHYIELIGHILSLICICFSLFIFIYHKFLFTTLNESTTIPYESQFVLINKHICPCLTALLEYIQTCNFMWMLNEGVYLNILLTYSIFDNNKQHIIVLFYIIGWGLPAVLAISWAATLYNTNGVDESCWYGFYDWSSYWIIQGPILTALIINILCLSNVIRILASKLRKNRTTEIEQIKKSAKAAILLLPLLGITHISEVYHEEPANFVLNLIVSIISAILVFYQGVFLSILYCFMNSEVKNVIKRHWLSKFKFKTRFCNTNRHRTRNVDNKNNNSLTDMSTKERQKLVDDIPLTEVTTSTNQYTKTSRLDSTIT